MLRVDFYCGKRCAREKDRERDKKNVENKRARETSQVDNEMKKAEKNGGKK